MSFCNDCNVSVEGEARYCRICGNPLVVRSNNDSAPVRLEQSRSRMLDIFTNELQDTIALFMQSSSPNRMVSKDYLSQLGKVELSQPHQHHGGRGILVDSFLQIGIVKIMTVLADFSPLPSPSQLHAGIVYGVPEYGESTLTGCNDRIVILKRGKVKFTVFIAKKPL
jgi:hypothetical protein